MHRCLQISEIVRNIVNILGYAETKEDDSGLLALVTVSKMFSEPALECLWAKQDSLPVLFKTLPRDLWNESGDGNVLVGLFFNSYQTLNAFLTFHN
jgi:hypothetical protein